VDRVSLIRFYIKYVGTSKRLQSAGYLFNIISGFKTMLAISNDLEECDTCVVLHCKKDDFEQNFLSTLMTMNSSANLPHNLVFVYITLHIEKAEESFHRSLWSVIYAVQENLGIFAYHKPDQEVDAPDIRDMPTKLTSLDTIATALEMEKKSIAQQIALLVELSDEFDTNHSTGTDVKFRERINILRLRNEHLHERIRETRANLQSMMQMVCSNLYRACIKHD
jgi:chaperonin cofactor prefoldin